MRLPQVVKTICRTLQASQSHIPISSCVRQYDPYPVPDFTGLQPHQGHQLHAFDCVYGLKKVAQQAGAFDIIECMRINMDCISRATHISNGLRPNPPPCQIDSTLGLSSKGIGAPT